MRSLVLPLLLVAGIHAVAQESSKPPDCREWQACRQLALEAAARQDYDAFHDLAWRTLQTGPKNDPALMTLLARAQSLSGRPHDALVMLRRLAAMGVTTDAATSDDFARVRALPGWAEFEAAVAGKSAPSETSPVSAPAERGTPKTAATPPPKPDPEKPATTTASKPEPGAPKVEAVAPKPEPATPKPEPAAPTRESARAKGETTATKAAPARLTFPAGGLTPVGLAYDAISGRFLVGDGRERRLVVIGERSGRLAGLAGTDAGFSEITSFEIDAAEGDLWVVSASGPLKTSTVHKLQLISGRVLSTIALAPEQGPARFTDVAVTPQGVLVLDTEGRRVFRAAKKGKILELVARLAVPNVSSMAGASDTIAYAAYDQGLIRVDLATRAITVVEPGARTDVTGLRWIRWHRGSLLAIQEAGDGSYRLIRIRTDEAGRTIKSVDPLDGGALVAGPTSAALSGNTLYYLRRDQDKDELEVKKLTLK
jgi:outer membrane biosynthesis protein TonB